MASKKLNPVPQGSAGRAGECFAVAANDPSYSAHFPSVQELRARFLARRFRVAPTALALAVAELHFGEVAK